MRIRIEGRAGGYQAWVMSDQGVELGIGNLEHTLARAQAKAKEALADCAFIARFEHDWARQGYTVRKAAEEI